MGEEQNNFTRRMFIKGIATSFGALPVFAWPRWAQAFYYNLGFFKRGSASSLYVEDVFSTYLYTGTDANIAISNGINLSSSGGMIWLKSRNIGDAANRNCIFDTARGARSILRTDGNAMADVFGSDQFVASTDGFTLSGDLSNFGYNNNTSSQASWTFRKSAKFFDIITYTGNGSAPRVLSHSLGVAPGMVIIKRTSAAGNWWVYHRSSPNQGAAYAGIGGNLYLDTADAADTGTNPALSAVSSSSITLSTNQNIVLNISGETYVAYLFAHDASTDGLIQCGSVTTDASGNATVSLGWEPQYVLLKYSSAISNWNIHDSMRGMPVGGADYYLTANVSVQELSYDEVDPTATGMNIKGLAANTTVIYLAIRRGPMKIPTAGTQVFDAVLSAGSTGTLNWGSNINVDMSMTAVRDGTLPSYHFSVSDRLMGAKYLTTSTTNPENISNLYFDSAKGTRHVTWFSNGHLEYQFRRAPGFFDIVAYTGTGAAKNENHGLGVIPELIIVKSRSGAFLWNVYHSTIGTSGYVKLNTNDATVNGTGG